MARFVIVNGPSKFDLMVSLFDGDFQRRKEITFTVPTGVALPPMVVTATISGAEREDGSGESWNFRAMVFIPNHCSWEKATGYYSTKTRQGFFQTS
jgi:hypothetical protein